MHSRHTHTPEHYYTHDLTYSDLYVPDTVQLAYGTSGMPSGGGWPALSSANEYRAYTKNQDALIRGQTGHGEIRRPSASMLNIHVLRPCHAVHNLRITQSLCWSAYTKHTS